MGPVEVSLRDIIFNCEANRMPFYRDLVYLKLGGLNRARFFLFSPDSSVKKADPGIFHPPDVSSWSPLCRLFGCEFLWLRRRQCASGRLRHCFPGTTKA